jgi:hypothetical protein
MIPVSTFELFESSADLALFRLRATPAGRTGRTTQRVVRPTVWQPRAPVQVDIAASRLDATLRITHSDRCRHLRLFEEFRSIANPRHHTAWRHCDLEIRKTTHRRAHAQLPAASVSMALALPVSFYFLFSIFYFLSRLLLHISSPRAQFCHLFALYTDPS